MLLKLHFYENRRITLIWLLELIIDQNVISGMQLQMSGSIIGLLKLGFVVHDVEVRH
jgi:hypothetical protein